MDMTKYWKVAEAKAKWSELLEASSQEPQVIQKRDQTVGVVVSPALLDELRAKSAGEKSMTDFLDELRAIQEGSSEDLEIPPRKDRSDVDL